MIFEKKITLIGTGKIGQALLGGIIKAELTPRENIIVTDILDAVLEQIENIYHVNTSKENDKAIQSADIILLAVKPQVIKEVLEQIRPVLKEYQLIISVAAGIKTTNIEHVIKKNNPILRVMPNIPALVDESATAIAKGAHANDDHLAIGQTIFNAVGDVVVVREEQLDAVTGLSGSGPAYIYMLLEALIDGGVKMGLARDVATRLSIQTVLGSAKLMRETKKHPAVLKDEVTTPGGTTIAAIHELEMHGLRNMLISAVETATKRSQELSSLVNDSKK